MNSGGEGCTEQLDLLRKQIVELKSPEGYLYAGLPKFRRLFGRDSLISSMQLLESDPGIARSTIRALLRYQGKEYVPETGEENGKILHEHMENVSEELRTHLRRVPWLAKSDTNYFSVDSTPLLLILADMYLEKTGDHEFIESVGPGLSRAASWILRDGMSEDLLVYFKARLGLGLQSQSWRDGIGSLLELCKDPVAVVGVQGYLIRALRSVQRLSDRVDSNDSFASMNEMVSGITERVQDLFYLDDTDYFAFATDGDGVAVKSVSSDPGHLLLSGTLDRKYMNIIVSRLMEPDMMTDYGIRSLSADDMNFDDRAYQRGSIWPHDNWLIALGLRENGYVKEYDAVSGSLLRAYEELGSIPEYFGVDRSGDIIPVNRLRVRPCDPQAWSAGALIDLIGSRSRE